MSGTENGDSWSLSIINHGARVERTTLPVESFALHEANVFAAPTGSLCISTSDPRTTGETLTSSTYPPGSISSLVSSSLPMKPKSTSLAQQWPLFPMSRTTASFPAGVPDFILPSARGESYPMLSVTPLSENPNSNFLETKSGPNFTILGIPNSSSPKSIEEDFPGSCFIVNQYPGERQPALDSEMGCSPSVYSPPWSLHALSLSKTGNTDISSPSSAFTMSPSMQSLSLDELLRLQQPAYTDKPALVEQEQTHPIQHRSYSNILANTIPDYPVPSFLNDSSNFTEETATVGGEAPQLSCGNRRASTPHLELGAQISTRTLPSVSRRRAYSFHDAHVSRGSTPGRSSTRRIPSGRIQSTPASIPGHFPSPSRGLAKNKRFKSAKVGEITVKQPEKKPKTRRPFEPGRRLEVRKMRQTGACFRCRWLKKPCDPGDPCRQCENVKGRLWTYPCLRINMSDLRGLSDMNIQKQQRQYLNSQLLSRTGLEFEITLTHGFSNPSHHSTHLPIQVVVEEIIPTNPQSLILKWSPDSRLPNGSIFRWPDGSDLENGPVERYNTIKTKPYAIKKINVKDAEVDAYLDCDRGTGTMDSRVGTYAEHMHGIHYTRAMLKAAWEYSERTCSATVRKAFRMMAAVYLQNFLLFSENSKVTDAGREEIQRGRAIASSYVQIQWNLHLDGRRSELEKEVLAELQGMIFSRKRGTWLTIFFTIYILLTTLEQALWGYNARVGEGVAFNDDFCSARAFEIANLFVVVFRALNQGTRPLIEDSDAEDISQVLAAEHGDEVVGIFRSVRMLISDNAAALLTRKEGVFDFKDRYSLEGKFSSCLVLE